MSSPGFRLNAVEYLYSDIEANYSDQQITDLIMELTAVEQRISSNLKDARMLHKTQGVSADYQKYRSSERALGIFCVARQRLSAIRKKRRNPGPGPSFPQAFMDAAQVLLDEAMFDQILGLARERVQGAPR